MSPSTNQIERLDLAARAVTSRELARRNRWVFLILNLIIASIAVGLLRQRYGPWRPVVVASFAVFTAVIMWSNWRFRLYVYGGWWIAVGLAALLIKTSAAWPDRLYLALGGGLIGFDALTQAGPVATVSTPEWDREQTQVEEWLRVLSAIEKSPDAIEFSTASFTRGNYLYRLMNLGQFWVVMKEYKSWGGLKRRLRVYELGDVTLQAGHAGAVTATIRGQAVRGVNFAPTLSARGPDR